MLVLPQCHAEQQVQPVSSWILVTSGQSSFSHTLAAQTPSYPQHLPSAKRTPLSPRCLRSPQLSRSQQPLQHQLTRWIQTKSLGTALTAPKLPCRFYCSFFFFCRQAGCTWSSCLPSSSKEHEALISTTMHASRLKECPVNETAFGLPLSMHISSSFPLRVCITAILPWLNAQSLHLTGSPLQVCNTEGFLQTKVENHQGLRKPQWNHIKPSR